MKNRRRIEERIRKKEVDIQELEAKIREERAYIQALQDVLKLLPREKTGGSAEATLRPGSAVAEARDAILKAGHPLHISELLKALDKENTRDARSSLSGSLSAYVRRDEVFTRPKPNTFGLVEMPNANEPESVAEPPGTFGSDGEPSTDDEIPF